MYTIGTIIQNKWQKRIAGKIFKIDAPLYYIDTGSGQQQGAYHVIPFQDAETPEKH